MKYLATAVAATVLAAAGLAQAQPAGTDEHHWQGRGENQGSGAPQGGPHPGGARPAAAPAGPPAVARSRWGAPGGPPVTGAVSPNPTAQYRGWSGQPGQPGTGQGHGWSERQGGGWSQNQGQGWTAQHGWQAGRPGEQHELRSRDQGRAWFDWNRFPREQFVGRRYHLGAYYYPPGWYARTWYYGDILPWGWYAPRYYLDDWMEFALPPPPIGCEWVRVGPDALLVDVWTGRILSVYRGIFW